MSAKVCRPTVWVTDTPGFVGRHTHAAVGLCVGKGLPTYGAKMQGGIPMPPGFFKPVIPM